MEGIKMTKYQGLLCHTWAEEQIIGVFIPWNLRDSLRLLKEAFEGFSCHDLVQGNLNRVKPAH